MPIARKDDWEDKNYRHITIGEKCTLIIVAILYIITTAAGMFTLYTAIDSSGC